MAKVVVTGGAGYVGGFMVDALVEQGHDVRVLENLLYEDAYLKDVEFFFGDVADRDFVVPHYSWADSVVFLAGIVGDPACALNPAVTHRANVDAVRLLAENFDGRVIFPSSCSVYGAQDGLLDEHSPVSPLSLYAATKLEAEEILLSEFERPLILRLGTLFGLSDSHARLRTDLVVNVLTIRAALESRMTVFGGAQYRPLLHVRDVSTAVGAHVDSNMSGIFNLLGENLTVLDMAERIREHVADAEIVTTDMPFQDLRNYRVDGSKARDLLGFVPQWSLDFGINQVLSVVDSRRIPDVSLPRFSNSMALQGR